MPYSQHVDGLDEFRKTLAALPDEILDQGERIVGKAMSNIKKDAQARVRAGHYAHLPHVARSFDYDVTRNGRIIRGEGGANRDRLQGELDIYLEMGTATSSPHPHWSPAFDAELPRFDKYAEDYLAELLQ